MSYSTNLFKVWPHSPPRALYLQFVTLYLSICQDIIYLIFNVMLVFQFFYFLTGIYLRNIIQKTHQKTTWICLFWCQRFLQFGIVPLCCFALSFLITMSYVFWHVRCESYRYHSLNVSLRIRVYRILVRKRQGCLVYRPHNCVSKLLNLNEAILEGFAYSCKCTGTNLPNCRLADGKA